mmetsp:Transcript_130530/g.325639  ORF Transcript_130530/g.325639 Transcript_130530/m.325639 type:complete len:233 (+) Transcript_130530:215-913(+)
MGQMVGSAETPASIAVQPEALEELAAKLGAARVPIELESRARRGTGTFKPLEPRDPSDVANGDRRAPVLLHVYDTDVVSLDSKWLSSVSGVSIFHVGVEVHHQEYAFSTCGIVVHIPGNYNAKRHRLALPLGITLLSHRQVLQQLETLKNEWKGEHYRVVGFNCQTFAVQFCKRLGLNEMCIPQEYVRFAHGLLPQGMSDAEGNPTSAAHDQGASPSAEEGNSCKTLGRIRL